MATRSSLATLGGRLPTSVSEQCETSTCNHDFNASYSYLSRPPVPQTTVMFADIAGFTAWSTAHSPAEVFQLLETLYGSFDEIAQRRRVFKVRFGHITFCSNCLSEYLTSLLNCKVETVGDCYVAVSGVPEPEKNHAVVMSRFARDCMYRMRFLTRKLEVTLGPDTGDLCLRAGLHSGPVTAGVLRGERSRFQLFGGTPLRLLVH